MKKNFKFKERAVKLPFLLTFWILISSAFINQNMAQDGHSTVLILEDGQYFNGKEFLFFKEIRLVDGKIESISESSSHIFAKRISVKGKFIIPGLIDGHTHFAGSPAFPYVYVNPLYNANASLNCGITSNLDLFFPEEKIPSFKDSLNKYPAVYASILMAGPILTAPEGHGTEYGVPTRIISSNDQARKITEGVSSNTNIDIIKVVYEAYSNSKHSLTKDQIKIITSTAHKYNKKVVAHINVSKEAIDCIDLGVDCLAHIPADYMEDKDLDRLKKSGIPVIPTITVYQALIEGLDSSYMSDSLLWSTADSLYLSKFTKAALPKPTITLPLFYQHTAFRKNMENIIALDIPVIAGTDAGNYAVFFGYSLHNELFQYVKAGMTPVQALNTATRNINLLFPKANVGIIKSGYQADLLVLNANPLENIANTKSINFVIHKGNIAEKIKHSSQSNEPITFDPTIFDLDKIEKLPEYINAYSDKIIGGTSLGSAELYQEGSSACIFIKGQVEKRGFIGFAGVDINLSRSTKEQPVKLTDFKSISFDAKGNNEYYYLKLVSQKVKDYNYHVYRFKANEEWTTFNISLDDLKQNPWYGTKMPLDLNTITNLLFEASDHSYEINFKVRNIHFNK